MKKSKITVAATLHDPDGKEGPLAEPFIAQWIERYHEVVVFTSPQGSGTTGAMLAAHGARVIEDTRPQGVERMGLVRLWALQAAAEGEADHVLLIDFDRLIHWEAHYPAELRQVEKMMLEHDFFVLGRSARAFESHPEAQRETERLINAAFVNTFGEAWDITGGARGVSAKAIRALSQHSRCATIGVDGEWPVLSARLGLQVDYLATEGLEYETADRFQAEIAELGYNGWLDAYINTPRSWDIRFRLAHQIVAATREACERTWPNPDSQILIRPMSYPEKATFLERVVSTSWDDLLPHQVANLTRKDVATNAHDVISVLMKQGESVILIADLPDLKNAGQIWFAQTIDPYTKKRRSYIYDLFVEPAARQQGVAQALLQAAETRSRQRGDHDLALTVACHNDSAQSLYQKYGFTNERLIISKPLED